MKIGMIGLGRMGGNMVRRLMRGGHSCVGYNRDPAATRALAAEGMQASLSLDEFVAALDPALPVAWVMVPAGEATESTVHALAERLPRGAIVIDGGNSYFKDDIRRAAQLAQRGIDYVDCGTSGGVWGVDRGYCLMVGATPRAFQALTPILRTLAPGQGEVPPAPGRNRRGGTAEEGFLHCGPHGAGHFVKMIHNGIEYGLMQAYAEGFALMQAREDMQLDIAKIAESWRHGTVIRSWLLDLTAEFLKQDAKLEGVAPFVADSGEGRWTALEAIQRGVPTPVMNLAVLARFSSQGKGDFGSRILAKMRQAFGGHAIKAK